MGISGFPVKDGAGSAIKPLLCPPGTPERMPACPGGVSGATTAGPARTDHFTRVQVPPSRQIPSTQPLTARLLPLSCISEL